MVACFTHKINKYSNYKIMRNYLLAVLFIGLFIGQVNAQDQNGKSADLGSMSKEFLNPLSDIWSIQIQNDFVFVAGDYISGNRKANFTNFQPIMPIPLGLGFSSTMKIGILPVNLSYETQYYVESPESYGAQWNFRFTLTTGIMNPFKK